MKKKRKGDMKKTNASQCFLLLLILKAMISTTTELQFGIVLFLSLTKVVLCEQKTGSVISEWVLQLEVYPDLSSGLSITLLSGTQSSYTAAK